MSRGSSQNILANFHTSLLVTGALLSVGEAILVLAAVPGHVRWLLAVLLLGFNTAAFLYLDHRRLTVQHRFTVETRDYQQVDRTLQIAYETLPYMRRGLNPETALKTAQIIQKISDVAAVAITDRERVLAFIGAGCENHPPGNEILTEATKEALATGQIKIVKNQRQLNCPRRETCNCPLAAAVIVPLISRGEVVGAVKLYETKDGELPPYIIKLATGIAQLLSMQIELADLDRQVQLACKAELDALRAQINPHFLFNTLNTIIMYSRTNPEKARRLLIHLAEFFRHTLKSSGHFHTFHEELKYIRTYLYLEKARFKDKLKVRYRVDPSTLQALVPVLTIQPIVENAVKHGIAQKTEKGTVEISATVQGGLLMVSIKDDGVGMPPHLLSQVLQPGFGSGNGVGLSNVWERLRRLYGEDFSFKIDSTEGKGTTVILIFPLQYAGAKEEEIDEAKSTHRG